MLMLKLQHSQIHVVKLVHNFNIVTIVFQFFFIINTFSISKNKNFFGFYTLTVKFQPFMYLWSGAFNIVIFQPTLL